MTSMIAVLLRVLFKHDLVVCPNSYTGLSYFITLIISLTSLYWHFFNFAHIPILKFLILVTNILCQVKQLILSASSHIFWTSIFIRPMKRKVWFFLHSILFYKWVISHFPELFARLIHFVFVWTYCTSFKNVIQVHAFYYTWGRTMAVCDDVFTSLYKGSLLGLQFAWHSLTLSIDVESHHYHHHP